MKINYLFIVVSLVCGGLASEAMAAPPLKEATAGISKVEGEGIAKVRRVSGIESVAGVKQELFPGDRLTTDARSTVEILLADGTLVRVGINSEYKIDSLKKEGGIFSWVFHLAKGSIRAMVEKNPNKNQVKFRVNTPVGTMGVRGTELVLEHNQKRKRTTLYTIEGRVEFGGKNCQIRRKCIEVKTGEMAFVGEKPEEQQPVAKPYDSLALLAGEEGQRGSTDAPTGAGSLSADERLERATLFTDLKNAPGLVDKTSGNSISAEARGDMNKLLAAASEAMAAAQDKLLSRTRVERENLEKSIANGSYREKLRLAEKFDDIRDGTGGKGKDRERENLSPTKVASKLKLAEAILQSKKMKLAIEKRAATDNALIGAKIKEAQDRLDAARAQQEPGMNGGSSVQKDPSGSSTKEYLGPNQGMNGAQSKEEAKEAEEVEEVKMAMKVMTKELADEVLKDETVTLASITYTYEDTECLLCKIFPKTKTRTKAIEKENTKVERKSGVCYETKKNCKRQMIPCNLKNGKSCKPTFTEYACTETKVQVACPEAK